MRPWREFLGLAFLGLIAVLPFTPAVTADFVEWDDDINITQNTNVQGLDGARLRWMFGTADRAMRYKPLNWLAWALIYQAQGLRPVGFHLANLGFHAANTVLFFLVLRRMLQMAGRVVRTGITGTGISVAAGCGALLWAWHPLRVEPVAWITGLPYGLSLFFMLGSWLAYLEANRAETKHARRYYWVAVAAYALAVLSYPIVIVFGAVLVAVDVALLRRFAPETGGWWSPAARRVWAEKIPFFLLAGAVLVPTLVGRMQAGAGKLYQAPVGLAEFGVFSRAMQAFYIWAYYAWKPLLPTDLAVFYTTLLGFNPTGLPFVLSLFFVVGVTVALFVLRRRWPGLLVLWLTYLAVTIPVLGLTERPHYPSDRYAHLPNLAWAVAIGFGVALAWRRPSPRGVGVAVSLTLALLFGLLSFWQTAIWSNSLTLFGATLESLEGSVFAGDFTWRLGLIHARAGNDDRAAEYFEWFRKTGLKDSLGHRYAAAFALAHDELPAANQHAAEALRINPDDPIALNVVAGLAFKRGDLPQARLVYGKSLAAQPDQPAVWEKLAATLDRLGLSGEAVQARERARHFGGAPRPPPPSRSGTPGN